MHEISKKNKGSSNTTEKHLTRKVYQGDFGLISPSVPFKVLHVLISTGRWCTRNLQYVSQLPRVVDGVETEQRAGDEWFGVLGHKTLPGFIIGHHCIDAGLIHSFTTILHLEHCVDMVHNHIQ